MKLEINPKAKESIDANALILLGAVAPQRPMRGSTKTQRYTTEISRDAVQELTEYEFPAADCDDTIRAFYFSRAQQRFGVAGDEVRKLHVVLDAL
jgi:hypothetical protein